LAAGFSSAAATLVGTETAPTFSATAFTGAATVSVTAFNFLFDLGLINHVKTPFAGCNIVQCSKGFKPFCALHNMAVLPGAA
jgi:hypothetical protein